MIQQVFDIAIQASNTSEVMSDILLLFAMFYAFCICVETEHNTEDR